MAPPPGRAARQAVGRLGAECEKSPPDIEAMVGVRGVLGPLEQRPLKLNGDLGGRVGRQLNQHLQQVRLQPVLRGLVVDVTWGQAGVTHASLLRSDYLHPRP